MTDSSEEYFPYEGQVSVYLGQGNVPIFQGEYMRASSSAQKSVFWLMDDPEQEELSFLGIDPDYTMTVASLSSTMQSGRWSKHVAPMVSTLPKNQGAIHMRLEEREVRGTRADPVPRVATAGLFLDYQQVIRP